MSKQAKLAALLKAVDRYGLYCCNKSAHGTEIIKAYDEYRETPDDPPQPPEMPECVRVLLDAFERFGVVVGTSDYVQWVRDHYAKPLKLEVGKCYEDAGGNVVSIVWQDPKFASHLVGVVRLTGEPRRYSREGSCCDPNCEGIIREVKS